jgi:tight adherence protein B
MIAWTPDRAIEGAGAGLLVFAAGLAAWSIGNDPDNLVQRSWGRYCGSLERKLHQAFTFRPGRNIAIGQLVVLFLIACLVLTTKIAPTFWVTAIFLDLVGPTVWLSRKLRLRVNAIDQQVEGFLIAVANALKSRPAIGDALASVVSMTPNPLRQELELAVKHMRLGSTVEQSLLHMSGRVGSRQLDTALCAMIIGRQVGGNLPQIMETTASAMREMARLEGVVRTKTAQGKAQLWVLALFPFALMFAFNAVSHGYFDPLTSSALGYLVTFIALGLWGGSIVVARRILAVDL